MTSIWFCRYGLSADIYSLGITIIEVALGHTPYMDMSFKQIAMKKAVNAGLPMLAVNTHGRHFSQVGRGARRVLFSFLSDDKCSPLSEGSHSSDMYCPCQELSPYCRALYVILECLTLVVILRLCSPAKVPAFKGCCPSMTSFAATTIHSVECCVALHLWHCAA